MKKSPVAAMVAGDFFVLQWFGGFAAWYAVLCHNIEFAHPGFKLHMRLHMKNGAILPWVYAFQKTGLSDSI